MTIQRLALVSLLILWPSTARAAELLELCDPDARANSWTRAEKAETRARVRSACRARGGSELYCDYLDAAVVRESWGGIASAVHRLGVDADGDPEYGLGPMGLSVKWHADKWPGDDEDPAFCLPEVSYLVADAIARRAVRVYGASNAVELQAVYGGGRGVRQCVDRGTPAWVFEAPVLGWLARALGATKAHRECMVRPLRRHADAVCKRMGVDCRRPLGFEDLGGEDGLVVWDRARSTYVVTPAGRAWALARSG
jgi:hypothetical protein